MAFAYLSALSVESEVVKFLGVNFTLRTVRQKEFIVNGNFLTILRRGPAIVLGTLTPVPERKRGIASLATPSLVNVGSPLVVRDFSLVPLRRELAARTDQTKKNDAWKSRQGVEGSLEIVSGSIRFSLPFSFFDRHV